MSNLGNLGCAKERTRTSTGVTPLAPQSCAYAGNIKHLATFPTSIDVNERQRASDFGGSPPIGSGPSGASIETTDGQKVLVDQDTFEWASKVRWFTAARHYAARKARVDGKPVTVYLHRLVAGAGPLDVVDHIDRNPLNCQRSNLRLTSHRGNARNCSVRGASAYRGVTPRKSGYIARIAAGERLPNGRLKQIHLGTFATPEEAARAYDSAAREHFGEHAALNFAEAGAS